MASKVLLSVPVPVDSEKIPTSGICSSDFELNFVAVCTVIQGTV